MAVFKKIVILFLQISISLFLLIFLFKFKQVDLGELLEIIKTADKPVLYLSFLVTFFGYFFCFLRWKMLLATVGINLPEKRLISAFSGGLFFNMFPSSIIGGDFVRSTDIGYHSKKTTTVVATVLLDRLSGFVGMIILALLALVFGYGIIKDQRIILTIGILTVLLLLIMLFIFNDFAYGYLKKISLPGRRGKIITGMQSVLEQMHGFKNHRSVVVRNLLLSIAIQAIGPVTTYMFAVSFHLEVNILYFFIFVPIISTVMLLPISIGGLGVRDYMTVLLFTPIGISQHYAFAVSQLGFYFTLAYAGIGGLIYVFTLHHRRV
jgi:glycosyltransferase 2 family protein